MKKILFVHGWYHSQKRYQQLKQDLQGYDCHSLDLPGFGAEVFRGDLEEIESYQVDFLQTLLEQVDFSYIIAHSWGCRILLQALSSPKPVCIFLNPAYGENLNLKFLTQKEKITSTLFQWGHMLPHSVTDLPIKLASLPSVNMLQQMDDILLEDVREADPNVASKILEIMASTAFYSNREKFPNSSYLLYSKQDRAIHHSCFSAFQRDFSPTTTVFPEVGHTLVLEDYEGLLEKIQDILRQEELLSQLPCCSLLRENWKAENHSSTP